MPRRRVTKKRKKSKKASEIGAALSGLLFRLAPTVVSIALVVGLFFGVKTVLYADSGLLISSIEVSPSSFTSLKEITRIKKRYMGKHLFDVNIKRVSREIERNSDVYEAVVQKKFPSSLYIEIKKRREIASIQIAEGGTWAVLSQDGVIISLASSAIESLPKIKAYDYRGLEMKKGSKVTDGMMKDILRFLKLWNLNGIAEHETIESLEIDGKQIATIRLKNGPRVVLGNKPSRTIGKMGQLMPLLSTDKRKSIKTIDIQYEQIVVKGK